MDFKALEGKTLVSVTNRYDENITFVTDTGDEYQLYHRQDCCECVTVESIVGDLDDLVNTPILMAEEVEGESGGDAYGGIYEWTFYKLRTIKGSVDIRWYGSSNGYYGVRVSFNQTKGRAS